MAGTTLYDFTHDAIERQLVADGVAAVHAKALFSFIHREGVADFGDRGHLLPPLQRWLVGKDIVRPEQTREVSSADGWTRKFLMKFADGREVESVLMGFDGRRTGCLSTQVGCAMGCVFCATGQMGFKRHLTAGEIVAQAHFLNARLAEADQPPLRNLVMMGMGEPLHNFDATFDALDAITDSRGLGVAPTKVTVSTVGHVDGILKMARIPQAYELSVSLHGASDEERGAIMPINRRWPLQTLLDACADYTQIKGRRVWIAWTLIEGVNDSDHHAQRLAKLLKGRDVHVNLIPLNPTEGYAEKPPTEQAVARFQKIVREESGGLPVTVRQRRGIDVDAGCGQLAS